LVDWETRASGRHPGASGAVHSLVCGIAPLLEICARTDGLENPLSKEGWRREKNWDPTFSTCRNEGAALAEASMEPGPRRRF
ncbi:MAG: hypothetical protein QOD25_3861, partial [Alphaproteobacteria bacterium]|nr:hypothetical protein [Alphaproteobacteria bacterium]